VRTKFGWWSPDNPFRDHQVSATLLTIPYVGFSPVRLQSWLSQQGLSTTGIA